MGKHPDPYVSLKGGGQDFHSMHAWNYEPFRGCYPFLGSRVHHKSSEPACGLEMIFKGVRDVSYFNLPIPSLKRHWNTC